MESWQFLLFYPDLFLTWIWKVAYVFMFSFFFKFSEIKGLDNKFCLYSWLKERNFWFHRHRKWPQHEKGNKQPQVLVSFSSCHLFFTLKYWYLFYEYYILTHFYFWPLWVWMGFFIKRLEENDAEKNLSHLFALPVRLVDNKMTMDRKKYLEGMFPKVIRGIQTHSH